VSFGLDAMLCKCLGQLLVPRLPRHAVQHRQQLSFGSVEIDETVTQELVKGADAVAARSPQPQRGRPGDNRQGLLRQPPRIDATSWINTRELPAQLFEIVIDRLTLGTNGIG